MYMGNIHRKQSRKNRETTSGYLEEEVSRSREGRDILGSWAFGSEVWEKRFSGK